MSELLSSPTILFDLCKYNILEILSYLDKTNCCKPSSLLQAMLMNKTMIKLIIEFSETLNMETIKYYYLKEAYSLLNTNCLCITCNDFTVWEQDEIFRLYKKLKGNMKLSGYRSHFRNTLQMRTFIGKLEQMSEDFYFEDWCCDGGGVLIRHKKYCY